MSRPTRLMCHLVLFVFTWAAINPAWAAPLSDDDDTIPPSTTTSDDASSEISPERAERTQALNQESLRMGILEVRPTFEAERSVPESARKRMTRELHRVAEKINNQPVLVMPYESIMKYLSIKEKSMFNKCWIDAPCLTMALKPAKLDIVVASKLRMTEIDKSSLGSEGASLGSASSTQNVLGTGTTADDVVFAEYSLFVRIIDFKNRRIIREFLVNDTDYTRLAVQGGKQFKDVLVETGFITDQPEGMVRETVADDIDAVYLAKPVEVKDKTMPLKIGAYTTLGLSVVAAGLGLTFGFLSNKAQDDANNAMTIQDLKDNDDKRKTYMITANTMYGLAGALAITSAVLFVFGYRDDSAVGSAGGISVTPDGGFMLTAQGRF